MSLIVGARRASTLSDPRSGSALTLLTASSLNRVFPLPRSSLSFLSLVLLFRLLSVSHIQLRSRCTGHPRMPRLLLSAGLIVGALGLPFGFFCLPDTVNVGRAGYTLGYTPLGYTPGYTSLWVHHPAHCPRCTPGYSGTADRGVLVHAPGL